MRQRIETANVSSRRRNQGLSAMTEWAVKAGWFMAAVLFSVQAQAATYYFHNDHLGTPQVLIDSTQQVVWKGEYDPFGKVTETVNTVEQNLRFPGQYLDRETGLHYNYFRTYDPNTGRYIESDPIGLVGGINTYGYAYQNSIRNTDPDGLYVVNPVTIAIAEGIINTVGALFVIRASDSVSEYESIWENEDGITHPTHEQEREAKKCDFDDDCHHITWSIEVLTRQLQFRRFDMQGSFSGGDIPHRKHYAAVKERLRGLISIAKIKRCRYTPQADIEVSRGHSYPTLRYGDGF